MNLIFKIHEDMIKRKLLRITKKEQILAIGMKED